MFQPPVHPVTSALSLLLGMALTLLSAAQAQDADRELFRYVEPGPSAALPLTLRLATVASRGRTYDLSHLGATLTPVTPASGQASTAVLSGPSQVRVVPNTPYPRQSAPLTFQTPATAGVYEVDLRLPDKLRVYTPPVSINPGVALPDLLAPGTQFLHLGGDGGYTRNAQPLTHAQLQGRLFTLKAVTPSGATFSVEGLPGEVRWKGQADGNFPNLAPVAPDPSLDPFRKALIGKPVWAYGGLYVTCRLSAWTTANFQAGPRDQVNIKRILRLARPQWSGAQRYLGLDKGGADLIAFTPIVVQVERPAGAKVESGSSSGTGAEKEMAGLFQRALTSPVCQTMNLSLTDTWSLPRTFSAAQPSSRVPVKAPDDKKGLDRWQYAWLFGFPSATYGPREELLTLPKWQYINIPFPITVSFDDRGKVTDVVVPTLP